MPRRRGITNDPPRRERELEREYSGFRNFRIEKKFPNQAEAQKWESGKFDTHPGGPKAKRTFLWVLSLL